MLRNIKLSILRTLKSAGVFDLVADSRWRRERLLILCYHGTALEDEHLWRSGLYMEPSVLEQRLHLLKKGGYSVLPLGEALQRLHGGNLPSRSVVITFDDGTYDFYKQVYPQLKAFDFPATVYQTTYHTDYQRPIFNLVTSYMLWKRRGDFIADGEEMGLAEPMDLRSELGRHKVVLALIALGKRENLTGQQKDKLAHRLGKFLGVDYERLAQKRMFHLMSARELQEVAAGGVDIELHTHRHCAPEDEALFRREIRDNRSRIQAIVSSSAVHFCYPSGVYRPQFLTWLREEKVVSATTCDVGLVRRGTESLLLPRFVDTQGRTPIEVESWLSGVGDFLALRRAATQKYVPR